MAKAARINHLCQSLTQDRDGWWWLKCSCRLRFGPVPDNDIAVDLYGDHLWELAGGRVPIATQSEIERADLEAAVRLINGESLPDDVGPRQAELVQRLQDALQQSNRQP